MKTTMEDNVWNLLRQVLDPELGANIVDLGLVYGVETIGEGGNKIVKITMTFTTPLCPYGDTLVSNVKEKIGKLKFDKIEVNITFNPPWSLEKISPELREQFMFPVDI